MFLHCQPTYAGMAGAYAGISMTEAEAACRLLDVPQARRADVVRDVLLMGQESARAIADNKPPPRHPPQRSR